MALKSRIAGTAGPAACFVAAMSMTAAPTQAAELPQMQTSGSSIALLEEFSSSSYDTQADVSEWRRCGWFGCRRGWRGRRGVRAGDVLAGVAIIGGIAAIASAANNNRRRDRDVVVVERDRRVERRDDRRDDDRRTTRRASSGSGIDNAVAQCLNAIERDVRVDGVDGASRVASGWVVTGTLFNGSAFSCQIGNDGRIADIEYGSFSKSNYRSQDDRAPAYRGQAYSGQERRQQADGQWSDDRYASARASMVPQTETSQRAQTQRLARYEEPADRAPLSDRFREGTQPRDAAQDVSDQDRPAQPLVPLTTDNPPAYPGGPVPGQAAPQSSGN